MVELKMENYAADDVSLNSWIDEQMHWISWEMFENQEKWVYMSRELGERRFPQFKSADVVEEEFHKAFCKQISWLYSYMYERWVRNVRLGNVDLGSDMELELRDLMGNEYFEEWEASARKHIFNEYAESLGVDKAAELFGEAWPDWKE